MIERANYIVSAPLGLLNVREAPDKRARVISQIKSGSKIEVEQTADVPDGWMAVRNGGYVMAEFLEGEKMKTNATVPAETATETKVEEKPKRTRKKKASE